MLWEISSYRRALVAVPNVCPIPRGNAWSTSLRPNLHGRTWILHQGFGNVCWMPRSIFHLELKDTQLDGAELITDLNTPLSKTGWRSVDMGLVTEHVAGVGQTR